MRKDRLKYEEAKGGRREGQGDRKGERNKEIKRWG